MVTSNLIKRLRDFSELSSIILIITGIIILVGWAFNISILKSPGPMFSTIKTNVAVGLIFTGLSLYLLQKKRNSKNIRRIAQFSAILVTLIGFLTLFEYLFNIDLFIDQILFKELPGALYTSSPNRMAITAAIGLFILGPSLLFLSKNTPSSIKWSQIMAIFTVFFMTLPLMGFLYGSSHLYYFPRFTGIAIYAALLLLLASLSILFAQPDQKFISIFTDNQIGSYYTRRIFPVLIIFIICIGLIRILGQSAGLYDTAFGISLLVLSIMVVYTILFYWFANKLNKIDVERSNAEVELLEYSKHLEEIVKHRTEELNNQNKELENLVENLNRSNKELGQFAYVSSHDLQEPLRMISSYMQLLQKKYDGKLDSKADKYIKFAVEGANRMQQLINDLLVYSRITSQAQEFQLVDTELILNDILSNLDVLIKENKALITNDPLPKVMADSSQLSQVFQNLIMNSIKFHSDNPPEVHVSAKKEGNKWLFSVKDNGIGIDPSHSERIFEVFKRLHKRREYPGTGIGLSICKKIIERHGGKIWVESEVGKGSIFYFTLLKEV
ncbi:MAG: ATP-binding protein [Methanobacteriaceae archaeon]|nr:ATP-binding protein [Methanobacteriaceae archaeon]